MSMQIISLVLIIAASYLVMDLLLGVIKVPVGLRKLVSVVVAAAMSYYAYVEIFLIL